MPITKMRIVVVLLAALVATAAATSPSLTSDEREWLMEMHSITVQKT